MTGKVDHPLMWYPQRVAGARAAADRAGLPGGRRRAAVIGERSNEIIEDSTVKKQTDPIMAELRAVREAYAAQFDYDVQAMFKDIRAKERASGHEYVRLVEGRVVPVEVEGGDASGGRGVDGGQGEG